MSFAFMSALCHAVCATGVVLELEQLEKIRRKNYFTALSLLFSKLLLLLAPLPSFSCPVLRSGLSLSISVGFCWTLTAHGGHSSWRVACGFVEWVRSSRSLRTGTFGIIRTGIMIGIGGPQQQRTSSRPPSTIQAAGITDLK